ncbi:MAG: hypothetical protein Q9M92_00250 [Enterobacterales bacterium]|nr:hypothetical protein [Enterobacterales bacterium]
MKNDRTEEQQNTANRAKNRRTLMLLFLMFVTPVLLAYAAYFGNWFSNAAGAQGEIITAEEIVDIEDFEIIRTNGKKITGKEFETLYWWIIPIDQKRCDQQCIHLNLYTVNQTYKGLGKEASRINQLAIFNSEPTIDLGKFPKAVSLFSNTGLKSVNAKKDAKSLDLPANYIYLVDPLGNIFMRYPLVKDEKEAMKRSQQLRKDILHLFKYSRLG